MRTSLRLNVDMKSTGEPDSMSIGEIAARFGLATHVLRHWESVGLLAPPRAVAGRRRYSADHLYRIAVILRAKEAGFGLDDIREMFAAPGPEQRTEVLRRRRAELARRIAEAQASLELIDCALTCDHDDFTSCPHFQAMVADRIGVEAPVHVPN
jgi:MerR family copper efflux transcriptional regulator